MTPMFSNSDIEFLKAVFDLAIVIIALISVSITIVSVRMLCNHLSFKYVLVELENSFQNISIIAIFSFVISLVLLSCIMMYSRFSYFGSQVFVIFIAMVMYGTIEICIRNYNTHEFSYIRKRYPSIHNCERTKLKG
jgi:hypothetical protein